MQSVQEKYKNLQEYLKSLGSVAVAFSSGVDSTFLLAPGNPRPASLEQFEEMFRKLM